MSAKHPFIGRTMIYRSAEVRNHRGQLVQSAWNCRVRVMAIADGYAMVRRPRAVPFVVRFAGLFEVEQRSEQEG